MELWVGRNSVNYKKDHFLFSPPHIPIFQHSKAVHKIQIKPSGLSSRPGPPDPDLYFKPVTAKGWSLRNFGIVTKV